MNPVAATKGTVYTRHPSGNGWIQIDLDKMEMNELDYLPFPEPAPPSAPTPLRFSVISVERIMEDNRIIDGLKKLKGTISDADYKAVYENYTKLRDEDIQTGEEVLR